VAAASEITKLDVPEGARMLADQRLTEEVFVMWDLIHDRSHMRGDLPFDPFMIKQRMPFFLYSLEELRCDLTAFRECVSLGEGDGEIADHARLVQYAVIFDRIFRFAITGSRVRNYDGLGGQLLFAWLHQRGVLHWTDTQLAFDWDEVPAAVIALSDAIDRLYWESIDRPKVAHWLAAYDLVRSVVTPHPASVWARACRRTCSRGLRRATPTRCWTTSSPVDVLRGAREEDAGRHRVDLGHHGARCLTVCAGAPCSSRERRARAGSRRRTRWRTPARSSSPWGGMPRSSTRSRRRCRPRARPSATSGPRPTCAPSPTRCAPTACASTASCISSAGGAAAADSRARATRITGRSRSASPLSGT
jgi:hypothetical protein